MWPELFAPVYAPDGDGAAPDPDTPPAATQPPAETPPAPAATPPAAAPAAPPAPAPAAAAPPPAKQPDPTPEPQEPDKDAPDWRASIVDEKLKNVASRFASPSDMAKAVIDLRTDNSKRIKLPDENASDEDKAAYRKAMGVPDTPEGYDYKPPEEIELSDIDKLVIDELAPLAHEAGISTPAFKAFMDAGLKINQELGQEAVAALQQYGQESETALKKEWGDDFSANKNLATRFVKVWGGDELVNFLNTTKIEGGGALGDAPQMVKLFATLGRRSDEGDLMIGSTAEEKQSIQTQIDELNAKVPVGSPGYTSPAHQEKLQSLYQQLYGQGAIVGAQGRAA